MTIDWTKPICLDTVPPRMALLSETQQNGAIGNVWASWRGGSHVTSFWARYDGMPEISNLPAVRNVRPGDFPDATPAPRDAAIGGLVDALRGIVGQASVREWNYDISSPYRQALDSARAALTAWEAVK